MILVMFLVGLLQRSERVFSVTQPREYVRNEIGRHIRLFRSLHEFGQQLFRFLFLAL